MKIGPIAIPEAGKRTTGTFTFADPTTGQLVTLPFEGKFRLPFGIDLLGRAVRHRDSPAHFYLGDDGSTRIRIRPDERSVGFPTVRLELRFP